MAECSYPHIRLYEHQLAIALYTACLAHFDDVCQHNMEAAGQFVYRFTRKEPQLHPALDRLTIVLCSMHELYPHISADAIVSTTLDGVTGMYIEALTKGQCVAPAASRYPYYLRLRKFGFATAYAHFNFTEEWAAVAGLSYSNYADATVSFSTQPW